MRRSNVIRFSALSLSAILFASAPANAAIIGTYVDATTSNTGPSGAITTVSDSSDDLWRHRTATNAEGGWVFEAANAVAEQVPALTTTVSGLPLGDYDVYVLYQEEDDVNNSSQWGIRAAVNNSNPTLQFHQFDGVSVDTGQGANGAALMQAYLGTVYGVTGFSVSVLNTDGGNVVVGDVTYGLDRTWYEGVAYNAVPEPSGVMLLGLALPMLLRRRRA